MVVRESIRSYGPLVVLGGLSVFSPLIAGGTTHLPVLLIRLVLLAALTAWVLVSMKSGGITVHWTPLFPVVVAFGGWAALSVVRSPYTAVSLQWFVSILSYAAMLFVALHFVESFRQVRWLVGVVIGMGLLEGAVGAYQFLWLGQHRATGTFFNPNFFATYEAAVFSLAFGLLCFSQGIKSSLTRWEKPILWLTAGVAGLAFVLAQSRGALLAFVGGVAFVGLYRFGRVFLAVLLLCLLAGMIIPNPLQQRVLTVGTEDPYAFTRLDIWKNSLQRIADHPWGVGLGLYKYTSLQYRFPIEGAIARYGKRAESAHNEYLQMAVELGLVGLAIFLVGGALLGREIRAILSGELEPWERGVVAGLTGGILGFLAHGAVDSVFHEPALVLLLVLFVGLILILKRLRLHGSALDRVAAFPYRPARVALIVVLSTMLAILCVRPTAAWYAFEAGEREMSAGRADRALDCFRWAARIDPGTSAYYDAAAFAEVSLYRQSGELWRIHSALSDLKVGLALNPLDGRLANRIGGALVFLAERMPAGVEKDAALHQAAAYFEQAMQFEPYSPFNYLELGRLRWAQGRLDEAQTLLKRATSFEPNFLPARVLLAELALKTGRKEAAASASKEILAIKDRFRGRTLTALERQFLDVDDDRIKRLSSLVKAP